MANDGGQTSASEEGEMSDALDTLLEQANTRIAALEAELRSAVVGLGKSRVDRIRELEAANDRMREALEHFRAHKTGRPCCDAALVRADEALSPAPEQVKEGG